MTDSPNLGLPYLEAAQAQKHVTHNEALRRLDALVQAVVADRTLTVPPVTPTEGDSYLPAAGASGAWTGHALEIAVWQDGAWAFYAPQEGWRVWSAADNAVLAFDGATWIVVGGATMLNPAAFVGVNATADTTNRLSVSAPATLLNHAGAGHQLKLNKSAAADTASLLYQTSFSGRAELGTTGDDDFHVKVSADGTSWHEAIVVDKSTGAVSFPNTSIGSGGVADGDKGDITVTASGATWTIDVNTIANTKLADMATSTFKGRTTAGTGDPEDLTVAQAKSLLNLAGTNTGDQTITLTSDVTGSGTGSFATTIAANAVTNAKLADMATQTFKGRTTAGTGDPEDLSIAQAKTLLNLTGTNSGDQTITLTSDVTGSGSGSFAATIANDAVTYAKMQNVGANSVLARAAATAGDVGEVALTASQLFGRGATGDLAAITLGTNLSMSGTTLNASGGGGGGLSDADYGDITVSGAGTVMAIDADAVTNAKLANVATATFKGRTTAGTGDPEDLTATQATALLNAVVGDSGSGGTKGLVPAPASGDAAAGKFMKADGTWAVPPGGGSGSPGGSTTQMQYNNAGAFGGATDLTYDTVTGAVAFGKWAKLWDQASDPALPSGGLNLFGKKLASRRLPRYNTPLDSGSFLQPFLATQKIALVSAAGNSSVNPSVFGIVTPTLVGTATARSVATTNMLTRTRRLGLVSAATAASAASVRNATAQWTLGNGSGLGGFFFVMIFNVSDAAILAAGRLFAGMSSQTTAIADSEPSGFLNSFGVGAGSADTNLKFFYGGSTAQTPIDLGASFPSDTTNTDLYRLCMFSSPSESGVLYYEVLRMNTGDVATGTLGPGTAGVTLPAVTTLLTYHGFRSNAGNATAVGLDFSQVYIETEQ